MGLSIRAYAQHRGVSHTAVAKAIKAGRIQVEADGKIDPVKADAQWARNTLPSQNLNAGASKSAPKVATPTVSTLVSSREAQAPLETRATAPDYQTSRARREYFEAKAKERDYLLSMGQLMRADEVLAAVTGAVATLRQRLESLPDILSPRLAAAQDEAGCRAILADELEHALEDTARQFTRIGKGSDPC